MHRLIAATIWGSVVATVATVGTILFMACASAPSDIIADYAACMADQSRPLYALAAPGFGGAFTAEDARVSLRAELASGETTIAEIEGAYAIFCDGN